MCPVHIAIKLKKCIIKILSYVFFFLADGNLWFEDRKAVKTKEEARKLFSEFHSSAVGAHAGILKTLTATTAGFYWPGMTVDIKNWVGDF